MTEKFSKQHNRNYLSTSAYLSVNKLMINILGLNVAVFLCDLLSKEKYFEDKEMLDPDGYFFNTIENREQDTGLGFQAQTTAIKKLEKEQIIFPVIKSGIPARQRFKINHDQLWEIQKQVLGNPKTEVWESKNYNKNNINKNNEIRLSKDNIRQSLSIDKKIQNFQRKFKPPKLQVKKKLHVQKGTSQSRLISKWNNEFPGYNHSDMSTKTIKRAVHYIDSLLDHTFHEGKLWNKDWLKYTGITEKAIGEFVKSISSMTDIFIVFNAGLKDMYLEGFAPVSKKGLPKALADVFFTPYTENNGGGKSKFIEAALRPPKPVKSKTERDPYPGITEDLVELGIIDSSQMKNEQWKKYYSGVKSVAEYLSEIDWNNQGALQLFLGGEEGNPYNLVMEYVKWMKGENPDLLSPKTIPDKWHFNMITPSFWMWNQFMYSVNRYWGRVFQNLSEGE